MTWLSVDWLGRKSHLISYASGSGTNYQMRITVHYGSGTDSGEDVYTNNHCKTDFGDIRFTADDGITLLDYWMESKTDGDNAVFWVRIPDDLSSIDRTIYVYYCNAGASTTSNGLNTFLFFDHFDGSSLNLSYWEVSIGPTPTVTSSEVRLGAELGGYNYINTINLDGITSGKEIRSKFRITTVAGAGTQAIGLGIGKIGSPTSNWDGWYESYGIYRVINDVPIGFASASDPTIGNYECLFRVYDGHVRFSSFDTVVIDLETDGSTVLQSNIIHIGVGWYADVYVDWIFERKFVDPEPINSTWGPQEGTLPTLWNLIVISDHDSPDPSVGGHLYDDATSVTCSVTSPVIESSISYTCTGWTGTGSVPSSGSSTSTTFTITEDSSITWNWIETPSPPSPGSSKTFKGWQAKIFINDLEIGCCNHVSVDYSSSIEPYYEIENPNMIPITSIDQFGLIEISGSIERAWINIYYLRLLFGGDTLTIPNAEFDMILQASDQAEAPVLYLYKCRFKKVNIKIPTNGWIEESFDFIANSAGTGSVPTPSICPEGEQIQNGEFETGDLTGWTPTGDLIVDTYLPPHSGTYCLRTHYYGGTGSVEQFLIEPVPVSCMGEGTEFTMWIRGMYGFCPTGGSIFAVEIFYTDDTSTYIERETTEPEDQIWVQWDLKPYLEPGKTVESIYIALNGANNTIPCVDDITFLLP